MKLFIPLILLLNFSVAFGANDQLIEYPNDNTVGESNGEDFISSSHCPQSHSVGNFGVFEVVGETIESAYNGVDALNSDNLSFLNGPYPNNCEPYARGTTYQYMRYGIAIARGYFCKKIRPLKMINYGCFCGSSNAGLNTDASDGVDRACQKHDHNLWAICQNPEYNNPDGRPCNCYENTPMPKCSKGKIELPKQMTACESACLQDLMELTSNTKINISSYSSARHHFRIPFTGGDMSEVLPYCSIYSSELPPNRFGRIVPEPEMMRGP